MIGTAPLADYWLIRTEDVNGEYILEEYNWVTGAEYADSAGADIIIGTHPHVVGPVEIINGKPVVYSLGNFLFDQKSYLEDWATLFGLLGEGQIAPLIAAKFPLLEAAAANALLESGQVAGNVVLLAPELMQAEFVK